LIEEHGTECADGEPQLTPGGINRFPLISPFSLQSVHELSKFQWKFVCPFTWNACMGTGDEITSIIQKESETIDA